MPKKGTPQYEIWKEKFSQKRAEIKSQPRKLIFDNQRTVSSLRKKIVENLIDEQDLLILMFLSDIDPQTLSVASLSAIQTKFKVEDEELGYVVSFFKTLAKDQIKLRLIGVYNFFKVNTNPSSYPDDFKQKYSAGRFKEKYGYSLDALLKLKDL